MQFGLADKIYYCNCSFVMEWEGLGVCFSSVGLQRIYYGYVTPLKVMFASNVDVSMKISPQIEKMPFLGSIECENVKQYVQ